MKYVAYVWKGFVTILFVLMFGFAAGELVVVATIGTDGFMLAREGLGFPVLVTLLGLCVSLVVGGFVYLCYLIGKAVSGAE